MSPADVSIRTIVSLFISIFFLELQDTITVAINAIINNESGSLGEKYTRVLEDTLLSIDVGQNIIVIKTVSGMAMGVAAALDALKWPEILGCIAGDDTIMCAAKTADMALGAAEKLRSFVRLNK